MKALFLSREKRLKIHQALSASKRAEHRYCLDLVTILGAVHRGVMHVIQKEHLGPPPLHEDAAKVAGLGPQLAQRIMKWQTPHVEAAFNRMAEQVDKGSTAAHRLLGIDPRHATGVAAVIDHARAKNVQLITNASETFLNQVRDVLRENEGETPETLRKLLEERVDVSRSRATLIARDQTLKLNSNVAQHRQRAAGISKYDWSGSLDERERPLHRDLERQIIPWDDPPVTNEDGDKNHAGEDYQCFPEDSEVQLAHGVVKGFRRWYDGELASVVLESNKTIRATPKHEVLTRRGWVALGALQLEDEVLEISEERPRALKTHKNDGITCMGEVFAALQVDAIRRTARLEPADFHGDGAKGNVDVVLSATPLSFGRLAGRVQCGNEHADSPEFLAQVVGVDRKEHGHFLQGLSARQQFVRVSRVHMLPFRGHVLNLETLTGWYVCQGIIVHNCRCIPIPILDTDEPDEGEEETAEPDEGEAEEGEREGEGEGEAAGAAAGGEEGEEGEEGEGEETGGYGGESVSEAHTVAELMELLDTGEYLDEEELDLLEEHEGDLSAEQLGKLRARRAAETD